MRKTEDRIKLMHERAEEIGRESKRRRERLLQGVAIAAGIVVVILTAIFLPNLLSGESPEAAPGGMYASIFSNSPILSYIVIGIIAFLLGAAVTIFCIRIKKTAVQEKTKEHDRVD